MAKENSSKTKENVKESSYKNDDEIRQEYHDSLRRDTAKIY